MSDLNRRLPPLNALVAFEAAFRHRSFTRAGEELLLSQASVSRRVRELELDLGVKLFERRRYNVVPTDEGERLASTVRLTLRDLAGVADRLRDRGAGADRLTVFSNLAFANALIAPIVGEFQRSHPDVRLHVLATSAAIDTVYEEFDIGLQYHRYAENLFDVEPIADDVIFPVCAPELAARMPAKIGAADLAGQKLLHFAEAGRNWPDWSTFLSMFRVSAPATATGPVFSSYNVCLDVAERGEGFALGYGQAVKSRLDVGRLVRVPGMTMPLVDGICVYRPKRARRNPTADAFLDLLRSRIEPIR